VKAKKAGKNKLYNLKLIFQNLLHSVRYLDTLYA
jgi:hypothetical protein